MLYKYIHAFIDACACHKTHICVSIFFVLIFSLDLKLVGWFMVLNATFNNISVISWRSVLLVKETRVQCWTQPVAWSPTAIKTTYGLLDIVKRQVVTGPNLNIWASTNIILYKSYFPGTR